MSAIELVKGKLTFKGKMTAADLSIADLENIASGPRVNIANELGLNLIQNKLNQVQSAVSNPAKYAENMSKELTTLQDKVNEVYKETYNEYIVLGFPASQAKENARAYAEAISKVEMQKLNVKYPSDLLNGALNNVKQTTLASSKVGLLGI